MDIVDTASRAKMMAGIKSKDTKPELTVRRYLHARGFRYKLHARGLPGSPDLVLPKYRVVVFVHGCFWHRHSNCRYTTNPQTNIERWTKKFESNVLRDKRTLDSIARLGWTAIIVWECEVRQNADSRLATLAEEIGRAATAPPVRRRE